jgi:hypothetical protein
MKKFVVLCPILLASCAVPSSGIVAQKDDMYTVTRQGNNALVSTDSLKIAASSEAESYCSANGKKFKLIHSKETPGGVFGRWPESEVLFKCE